MSASAIQLVSRALQQVLRAAFAANGISGDVFIGPLDDPDAKGAAAVLFLYRVAANTSLRNTAHPRAIPPAYAVGTSLPLDLYYLLTTGTSELRSEVDGESLHVLGVAMQALQSTPNLVGQSVQGETIRLTLDALTNEEMSRIWTLFPAANYRTSVAYVAAPVWIDPPYTPLPVAPVVDESYAATPISPGAAGAN